MKTLVTNRLLLTPLGSYPNDIADIQRYITDYEVAKYLIVPWPYPADGAKTFLEMQKPKIEKGDALLWGIRLGSNPDELIGCIDYRRHENEGQWGRGFWLARPFHGHGYMTEAVAATLDYMFDEQGMKILKTENFLGNTGSRRIKEKTGCRFLGVFEKDKPEKGSTHEERWELTKEMWADWKSKNEPTLR